MTCNEISKIIKISYSKSDVCRNLGWSINGWHLKKVTNLIEEYNIDTSHFDNGKSKVIKYERITKECPVCSSVFETLKGHKNEKTTCSCSCSNSYFRSNTNNPNWKEDVYRSTCFHYHTKKCIVCEECNIVTVHHYDGNNKNNHPTNLIPLCPTHHHYIHSSYAYLVKDIVDTYYNKFKITFNE